MILEHVPAHQAVFVAERAHAGGTPVENTPGRVQQTDHLERVLEQGAQPHQLGAIVGNDLERVDLTPVQTRTSSARFSLDQLKRAVPCVRASYPCEKSARLSGGYFPRSCADYYCARAPVKPPR